MAVTTKDCIDYMNNLLAINKFKDYCPNGLQVAGVERVTKVVSGVSACEELFVKADHYGADLIIVHHGLFWHKQSMCLTGVQYARVKQLLLSNINLAAYHLPLDAHAKLGNNINLARLFNVEFIAELDNRSPSIGIIVKFLEPCLVADIVKILTVKLQRTPEVFGDHTKKISTLAICSGAAQHDFYHAIDVSVDAFITGEVSEFVPHLACESGVVYFAAGHHATEMMGVKALGDDLAAKFDLEHKFINVENKV